MTFARSLTEFRERRQREKEASMQALCIPTRSLHRGTYEGETSGQAVEKECPVRSEEYRRLVAMLPCKGCGIGFLSQAAHPNTGKGGAIKTDDRECFPLCVDSPGRPGCHPKFDQGALFDKATRRLLEPAWSADTRRQVVAAGMWPKNLPMWEGA